MNIGCISKKVLRYSIFVGISYLVIAAKSQAQNGGNAGCGTLISGERLSRRHLASVCAQPIARYEVGLGVEGNETISNDRGY